MNRKSIRCAACVLCMLMLMFAAAMAQSADAPARIGLVLGGGGARGAAHIGVLKVLERERIPVHAIAGTSVGSIIGGMYAAGYSPEEIEQMIGSIDWFDIFDDNTVRPDVPMRQKETDLGNLANLEVGIVSGRLTIQTTLVRGQKLGLFLRKAFLGRANVPTFDALPIPFRCVATDIGVVQPVVFSSGDLEVAIRASMAVPGAFAPVRHDGKLLVDGGVVDNVPIGVAREMGVDHVIAVDVGQPLAPPEEVESTFDILVQMVGGMMRDRTNARLQTLTDEDVLIEPQLGELTSMGFQNTLNGVEPGVRATEAVVAQLRRFALPEPEYLAWQAAQRQRLPANPRIEFVEVDTTRSRTAEFVHDRIDIEPGEALDTDTLEQNIAGAFGRGTYDYIGYRLATDEAGRTGLDITPIDSSLGRSVLRAGLQINDDFEGTNDYQLNLELRMTGLSDKGAEWRTLVGMGRVAALMTDLYLPFAERGNWFVAPEVGYVALNQPIIDPATDVNFALYRIESWSGALRVGRDFSDRFRVTAGLVRGQDHAERLVGGLELPESQLANLGGYNVTALWDNLDNVRFPRHGARAEVSFTNYGTSLGSDEDGDLLRVAYDQAFSAGRNTVMLGARASLAKDPVDAYQSESSLGGLTFLSGLRDRELVDNQMLLVRSVFYHRLSSRGFLFDLPVYLGGSIEGGNVWTDYDQVSFDDLIGAGSVFLGVDLPIGPLQFGYGRTFDGDQAIYLTFSSLVLPRYR